MEGKIWGMTGSYTNVTICLPRYPGAPSKGLGWRQAALSREPAGLVLRGLERHGCPELLLWSPDSPGGPMLLPCHVPYSCLGKVEPRGKWVLWNSLGEGKRTWGWGGWGDGLLAVQMQYSFPSVTSELPTVVI